MGLILSWEKHLGLPTYSLESGLRISKQRSEVGRGKSSGPRGPREKYGAPRNSSGSLKTSPALGIDEEASLEKWDRAFLKLWVCKTAPSQASC